MERYALFFDLDGTLMEDVNHLYPRIEECILELKKNGHKCFVATGRGYSNVPEVLKCIMDGFITLTGSSCIVNGEKLISHRIDQEDIKQFADLSFSIGAPIYLENDNKMDVIASDDFSYENEVIAMRGYLDKSYKTMKEYLAADKDVMKMDTRMRFKEEIDNLPAIKTGKLITMDAGEGWLEILINGVDKGTAIKELCDKIGHDIKKTVCFGDSENDLAMFEVCGISIAVSNASNTVKEKATIQLSGNNQDALIAALKDIGLLMK